MSIPDRHQQQKMTAANFLRCSWLLMVALFVSIPLSTSAAEIYSATYEVETDGTSLGKLERTLEQGADGAYILKTKSYVTGFWATFVKDTVNEESHFSIIDGKIVPKSYHYVKKKRGKLIKESVTFDVANRRIHSSSASGEKIFPFNGDESDKLIYQFRIRAALRRGERDLEFPVIDRQKLKLYRFKVGKRELLDTPVGKIEAVRVDRLDDKKRKTSLWFAPALDYLPVKIVQTTKDRQFSSIVISTSLKQ